ncbi:hypothetical protein L596_029132 [Steinernema carpocapsae]|uniref:Uncharacterized protein n=1 Tax=Steinernema carpocapsae TaxID=34508 RepID=A0A4U5LTQ8_STECR|nr:hypothetical protein L596_029132 [Steinernema carpocapsae]
MLRHRSVGDRSVLCALLTCSSPQKSVETTSSAAVASFGKIAALFFVLARSAAMDMETTSHRTASPFLTVAQIAVVNCSLELLNPDVCISPEGQFGNLDDDYRMKMMRMAVEHRDWQHALHDAAEEKLLQMVRDNEDFKWGTKGDAEPNLELKFNRFAVSPTTVKKNRWHALAPEESQNKCSDICEQLGIGITTPQSPVFRPKKKTSILRTMGSGGAMPGTPITMSTRSFDDNDSVPSGVDPDEPPMNETADGDGWITVSNREKSHSKSAGGFGRGFGKPSFAERRNDIETTPKSNNNGFSRTGFSKPPMGGFSSYNAFPKSAASPGGMSGFAKAPGGGGFSRPADSFGDGFAKRAPSFPAKDFGGNSAGGFSKPSGTRPTGFGGGFGGGFGANGGFGAGIGVNGGQPSASLQPPPQRFGGGLRPAQEATPAAGGFGPAAAGGFGSPAMGGFGASTAGGFGAPAAGGFATPTAAPAAGGFGTPTAGGFGPAAAGGFGAPAAGGFTAPTAGGSSKPGGADASAWDDWNSPGVAPNARHEQPSWDNWDQ